MTDVWKNTIKKDDMQSEIAELEKVAKELDKAVEMHKSQAERIRKHIKKMQKN